MNKIKILIISLVISLCGIQLTGCTDDFENLNTDPASLPTINPEEMLYTAEINMLTSGHCWNAIYASKYRWLQYGAGIWGYTQTQYDYFSTSIGNSIYGEYNDMGSYVTNIKYLSSLKDNASDYSNLNQVARILLIAKGIQTSDMFGSLVYSQGWLAREGKVDDVSMTPEFETQEQLVAVWDNQLKECITNLQGAMGSSSQVSLKGQDRAYNGDTQKWIKAANAIRLRLASRILKREPAKAKTIATEVLASSNTANVFSSNDDSFILWFDNLYTNIHGGDWHSIKDMDIATYCMMDYLNRNEDPRRRMYFVINNLTPENVTAFNAQQTDPTKLIPDTYTRWEGSSASYDSWTKDRRRLRYYLEQGTTQTDMRPANMPQVRLWKGNDTEGSGGNWAPVMTYADFCFLAAEFVLTENIPSAKTAQKWYEDGVRASLDQWNALGKFCDIANYEAMTEAEITNFLSKPDIKWNAGKGLEQIYAQTYIEHFKNVDEAYAFWKRTNYPNRTSSIVKFEEPIILGVSRIVPRKVIFSYPNEGVHNYINLKKRLDDMKSNPEFGNIDDAYGRLWWDKE
ncbi:SusD/RagB family nutrient-binding outer membrane lipoprotein [Dysgonomonas sp. ZJ279]|uniref:SusD/RagB family nutrient-binding outer membrane lipoprotein n=1 Tax=Dysgonomonas sp. ZJ279 TaxID=2709796 RepID=UPI0013ED7E1D|nr:SusD/RagB family nutrient-binding outer membrane lipoprotein [Dysgonomonas sp. ZJ279]